MSIEDSHCQMGKKISVLTTEADGQATFIKTEQCQKIKEIPDYIRSNLMMWTQIFGMELTTGK